MPPIPKPARLDDPEWLDVIRRMPCCVCRHLREPQRSKTEANHTKTRGARGGDDTAAPMCFYHHQLWHLLGRETAAKRWGIDPRKVAKELWAARSR